MAQNPITMAGTSDSLQHLFTQVAEMQHEVASQRIASDYFATILQNQTAIFTLITSGFFLIVGLLSYISVKSEIKKAKAGMQKQLDHDMEEIEQHRVQMKELEKSILKDGGYISVIIAQQHSAHNQFLASAYALRGAEKDYRSQNEGAARISLDLALRYLKACIEKSAYKTDFIKKSAELRGHLEPLLHATDEELVNRASEYTYLLTRFTSQDNSGQQQVE